MKYGKQAKAGHSWQRLPMTFLQNLVLLTLLKIKLNWVAQMKRKVVRLKEET